MKTLLIASLVVAPLAARPAVAAPIVDHPSAAPHRVGTFGGARLRIPMGGKDSGQPRLGLALSGIDYRQSTGGAVSVRFADGAELGFAADRIGLSLAGRPVRTNASLQEDDDEDGGISTGLLIAGGVVIGLGIGALLFVDALNDSSE